MSAEDAALLARLAGAEYPALLRDLGFAGNLCGALQLQYVCHRCHLLGDKLLFV